MAGEITLHRGLFRGAQPAADELSPASPNARSSVVSVAGGDLPRPLYAVQLPEPLTFTVPVDNTTVSFLSWTEAFRLEMTD